MNTVNHPAACVIARSILHRTVVSLAKVNIRRLFKTVLFRRVRKIAKSDCELYCVCPSAWKNSAPTGRIFMNPDI
jgi:hypothetical protein